MKLYDCSRRLNPQMPVFPGNKPPVLKWLRNMKDGGKNNLSAIELGSHTGTHADAPFHFIAEGKTLDDLPLDTFVGPCRVAALLDVPVVTQAALETLRPRNGEILLLKTKNSLEEQLRPFHADYVGLDIDAGRYLARCGVKTIGVDYLSVEDQSPDVVHQAILGAGIGILEGLYLKDVPEGDYFLCAAPLKVDGAEGAPCRAILVDFQA